MLEAVDSVVGNDETVRSRLKAVSVAAGMAEGLSLLESTLPGCELAASIPGKEALVVSRAASGVPICAGLV